MYKIVIGGNFHFQIGIYSRLSFLFSLSPFHPPFRPGRVFLPRIPDNLVPLRRRGHEEEEEEAREGKIPRENSSDKLLDRFRAKSRCVATYLEFGSRLGVSRAKLEERARRSGGNLQMRSISK